MGLPMASNLIKSGVPVLAWNRTTEKTEPLKALGAMIADSPCGVFEAAETVVLMLANERAIDSTLERGSNTFVTTVAGHAVINMSTTSAAFSLELETDIRLAKGHYIEAPVSGSPIPAEKGELIAMVADDKELGEASSDLLAPMC